MTKSRMPRPKATANKQIDNDKLIVTQWNFAPGAETGWHKHECDYVVVPLTGGELLLETVDDIGSSKLQKGVSYYRPKGMEHNVINNNDYEFIFIEIELK